MKKKIIALALATTLAISGITPITSITGNALISTTVEAATPNSGTIGSGANKLNWSFSGTTLTISGYGAMKDFSKISDQPWKDKNFTKIVIEEGVTSIGKLAFSGTSFETIKVPATVTKIGAEAFKNCKKLKLTGELKNTTTIGKDAFYGCTALYTIGIADNCTIGENAFSKCDALANVKIGNNVTIGKKAFYGSGVKTLETGADILINEEAFAKMETLTDATIGDNGIVYKKAFYDDNELAKLTVGQNVTFGSSIFQSCAHINELIILSQVAPGYSASTFPRIDSSRVNLFVPNGATGYNKGFWAQFKKTYNRTEATIVASKHVPTPKIKSVSFSGKKTKKSKVTVKFSTVKGAKKYRVQYSESENFADYKQKDVTKNTFSFNYDHTKDLYVRVCAYKKINGMMVSGNYSKVKHDLPYSINIGSVKMNKSKFTYDGKVHVPTVTVKTESGKTLLQGTDYDLEYSEENSSAVGKYKIKVVFKGDYAVNESRSLSYEIK